MLGAWPTSCSIGEPLALDAFQRAFGGDIVVHAERHAGVVAKIELGQ